MIKSGELERVPDLLDGYVAELKGLLAEIKLLVEQNTQVETPAVKKENAPVEELFTKLADLEVQLQGQIPKACKEIIADIQSFSWPAKYTGDLNEIERLILSYKFKDALGFCANLKEKFGEGES